ncbi:MAG: zf-TFIIB domain-containing protein [Nocardioidaceae bacterium]
MDEFICPSCGSVMQPLPVGRAEVKRCSGCSSLFLDRADFAALGEAENDWHLSGGYRTEPIPRITEDMTAPPPAKPRAQSFLESLVK